MFGKRITLFRLMGFQVRLDFSWIFIAFLVTWSLAAGLFPDYYEGLSPTTYWGMGIAGALGLFASIVFHEFGHSVVARRHGIPMKGITLFIFGGVAEMESEPPTPKSEFLMAIAGPIASILLAAIFLGAFALAQIAGAPPAVTGVLGYLGWINGILVAFNLVPAFPLDGGRVLRSALWGWKKNLRWATRVASIMGTGFGLLLIGLGIFSVLFGSLISGLWWFLLGLFIRSASQMSYQQVLLRQALEGEPIRRFMRADPISVASDLPLSQVVEDYFYTHHHKVFPVVDNGHLLGCVSVEQIKQIPKEEWPRRTARDISIPCSEQNTITSDTDAVRALSTMNRNGTSRLMVVDHDRLVGIISLRDLLNFLALKVELEEAK